MTNTLTRFVGRTAANDGEGLKNLLGLRTLNHTGNFVFTAETMDGRLLTIHTEPTDGDGDNIEITGIQKRNPTGMTKEMQKIMKKSQENALGRFMAQIGEINERLAELQAFTDDHMGYSPDDINWGHVGTAGYFLEKLTEMTDRAYKRGEYAE